MLLHHGLTGGRVTGILSTRGLCVLGQIHIQLNVGGRGGRGGVVGGSCKNLMETVHVAKFSGHCASYVTSACP